MLRYLYKFTASLTSNQRQDVRIYFTLNPEPYRGAAKFVSDRDMGQDRPQNPEPRNRFFNGTLEVPRIPF